MVVDGKALAENVYRALGKERALSSRTPVLGIVMGKGDAATESFVRIKTRAAERLGVTIEKEELLDGAMTEDAVAAVERLSMRCDGIIVQLPLPQGIDTDTVLAAIPPQCDVDAVNDAPGVHAPVAEAMKEIFDSAQVNVWGKKAVVIGDGRLVGKPCAELLRELGAKVSVITHEQGSLDELKTADIIVSGAGEPGLITPDHVKEGVVLIDAGTSGAGASASRRIAGDASPECASKASVFTPVPGGVGPLAVAMIFKNLFALMRT